MQWFLHYLKVVQFDAWKEIQSERAEGFVAKIQCKSAYYTILLILVIIIICTTDLQVPVVTSYEFCQGKTHRWGIAWSFHGELAVLHSGRLIARVVRSYG